MTVETSAPRRIGWAGPLAALSFTVSVVVFAAMRTDGYSHATKAVSELGPWARKARRRSTFWGSSFPAC